VEESADGGFGAVEDGGDFGGGEIFEGGEKEGLALVFGEAVEGVEDEGHTLGFGEGLVGGEVGGDEGLGEEGIDLVGADAALAVEGEVPGDADEPGAEVADGGKLVLVLEDAEERVLDDVFGFGAVAEDGVSDAEEEGGVGGDEVGEVELGCAGEGFRWGGVRQNQAVTLNHVWPSIGTDGGVRGTLVLFLGREQGGSRE
jgi:hypothetical protein